VHPDPDCEDCGDSCPGKCSDPDQIRINFKLNFVLLFNSIGNYLKINLFL
jgi:hypothetical protein